MGENDRDLAGFSVSGAGDVNGDGRPDLLLGVPSARDDTGSGIGGATYVVFGNATAGTVDLAEVAAGSGGFKILAEGLSNDVGFSVSDIGDLNNDGLADLLVGAPGNRYFDDETGTERRGAAYVVFGKMAGDTVDLADVAAGDGGFKIFAEDGGEFGGFLGSSAAGWSVSVLGDMNGDWIPDLLIGDPGRDGPTNNGAAYVVFGKADGGAIDLNDVATGSGSFKIFGEPRRLFGESNLDGAGRSVSGVGDVNGDGRPDLLIGAFEQDDSDNTYSAAYLVFGKADTAAVELADVAASIGGIKILTESTADEVVQSVSGAGDVNGDGLADLLVGVPLNGSKGLIENGAAYVIFGQHDWVV